MLKVVTPEEMRKIEQAAILAGNTVETLMEQAGKGAALEIAAFVKERDLPSKAFIFTGKGNNGGDGYVVARYLHQQGFTVQVVQVHPLDPQSLVKKERRRFEARGGKIIDLDHAKFVIPQEGVIVDAIFGTGFRGNPDKAALVVIEAMNASHLAVFSIDVPSGLNAETGEVEEKAVEADFTCTMEFPKLGFYLGSGWNHVGSVISIPIGLNAFAEIAPASFRLLEEKDVAPLVPRIVRNRHKYQAGHVVGLAGSHGMPGAAFLASLSALRCGAGIVHLLHAEEYSSEFIGGPLEIVRIGFQKQDLGIVRYWLNKASGFFLGPGLGTQNYQEALLDALWPDCKGKMVIDADALAWLALKKGTKFGPLPNAILTPHLGELQRFLQNKDPVTKDLLMRCQNLVDDNQTHLVLKGGPSFLFSHGETPIVMSRGDPGMATAGSGDVLTGILASLLSQGLEPREAMRLGTFMHGMCGEFAAKEETSYCMIASSLIAQLPKAYKALITTPHY